MTRLDGYWAGVLAFAVMMTGASAPNAQSTTPSATAAAASDPATVDQARKLRKEGLALHDKRDFPGARAKYLAAWKLSKSYALAANLGGVELALNQYRDAAEHLAFAVRESPREKDQDALARVQSNYEEAKQHVGALSIVTDVDGAVVVVNGNTVGRSPLADPVFVDPGTVKLQAQSGNRISEISTVEIPAGASREIRLTLREPAPVLAASAAPKTLAGSQPIADTSVSPASRDYSFETPQKVSHGPKLAPVLVGAGLTLAGVVAGVALGAVANSKADRRDEALGSLQGQNPCGIGAPVVNDGNCRAARSNEDEWRTTSQLSIAAYVGAGIFAAGTLGYVLLTWPKAKRQTGITPILGPNHGQVMLRTEF